MKTLVVCLICVLTYNLSAKIDYINFDKIPNHKQYAEEIQFLFENESYFDHWTEQWNYDKSKYYLIKQLKQCYGKFSKNQNKNAENYLLLGEIARFLYNLDQDQYFDSANTNYLTAVKKAPKDYRTYWFLANHLCKSTNCRDGLKYFKTAEKYLPPNQPAEFWDEYGSATYSNLMISNTRRCIQKAKKILGKPGTTEQYIGKYLKTLFIKPKTDTTYAMDDIWNFEMLNDNMAAVYSRPFGIKFTIHQDWGFDLTPSFSGYTIIKIIPPPFVRKDGFEIFVFFNIFAQTAQKNQTFEQFIDEFLNNFNSKDLKQIKPLKKYKDTRAYQIRSKEIYPNMGGSHINIYFIKRKKPLYPGVLIEEPVTISSQTDQSTRYIMPKPVLDRFDSTIYYVVIYDAAEDAFKGTFDTFKKFFYKQLIIE